MDEQDAAFETLLAFLKDGRAFDFTGYKRTTLQRRVLRRMQDVKITDYRAYRDYLEVHPAEFTHLFNTILINVTSFRRDPRTWEYLESTVVPAIAAGKQLHDPVRVWSAGCASGEEAYTLAIVLAEVLGRERFRNTVKIYATDVDEEALATARQATYSADALAPLPEHWRDRYFERDGDRWTVSPALRRAVIFGRHDLVSDAPIPRVDLIACRNTLMYFNADTQGTILARLHFALRSDGYLFLGKVEMLLSHQHLFTPVDFGHRVFSKVPVDSLRHRQSSSGGQAPRPAPSERQASLPTMAFDHSPVAELIIDTDSMLVLANQQARSTFEITAADVGRPFQDLRLSYRPAELRSHIAEVIGKRAAVTLPNVQWRDPGNGSQRDLEIHVVPVTGEGARVLGVLVSFLDITVARQLQAELEQTHSQLESAYEELQSANEELETTNEELQSTNEELETINEELRSANDEMQEINEELQGRTAQLSRVNAFLESVMSGIRSSLIVVDREGRVTEWNTWAEELWGLRFQEVAGQPLAELDFGLPVHPLAPLVDACLHGSSNDRAVTLSARNRVGRTIRCEVTVTPLLGKENSVEGVILLAKQDHDGPEGTIDERELRG